MYCSGNHSEIFVYDSVLTFDPALALLNNASSCNCSYWNSDTVDARPLSIIRILTSLCSIIGSASIILSVLLTGKLNAAEVHPLFILSVSDFILAILWMIGGIVWLNPGTNGWANANSDPHTGMCYVLAVATTMATMVTFSLTAVYAQSAMLRLREFHMNQGKQLPKQDKRKTLRHVTTVAVYIFSWVYPLIVVLPTIESVVGIEETNKGCWCILDFFNLRPDDGQPLNTSSFHHFALAQATMLSVSFLITSIVILDAYDVEVESFTSGGETFQTLFSKPGSSELTTPSSKRAKVNTSTSTSGMLSELKDDHDLKCNTVKDKTTLNHKTAGILMGAWPCGKIVMLGELYGSESLSRVYGQVHTLLQENTRKLNGLRFLCYDDGCHLKKFACNSKRKDSTTTSKWISSLDIVVDKLHFRGHVDKWCHEHCNPNDFDELNKVYYSITFYYVRGVLRHQRELLQEQSRGSKTIRTITIRLSLFLVIFFICGLPSFLASILVWSENDRLHLNEIPDRIILYLHGLFSPLQGFLNAIVYGWSRREFRRAVTSRTERMRFSRSQEGASGTRYQSLNRSGLGNRGTLRGAIPEETS